MSDPEPKPLAKFYQTIGECLHVWSIVEIEITTLFTVMHDRPWNDFDHPLRAAFEAIISLEGRLGMIKATVAADPKLKVIYTDHWNKLQSKILKSYHKRHEVAHFTMVAHINPKDLGQEHFIQPYFKWKNFIEGLGTKLSLKQVEERKTSFLVLVQRVRQHVQYVGIKRGLSASHFARAGDVAYPDLDIETDAA